MPPISRAGLPSEEGNSADIPTAVFIQPGPWITKPRNQICRSGIPHLDLLATHAQTAALRLQACGIDLEPEWAEHITPR